MRGVAVRPFLGIDNALDVRFNGSTVSSAAGSGFFEPSSSRAVYGGVTVGAGLK